MNPPLSLLTLLEKTYMARPGHFPPMALRCLLKVYLSGNLSITWSPVAWSNAMATWGGKLHVCSASGGHKASARIFPITHCI